MAPGVHFEATGESIAVMRLFRLLVIVTVVLASLGLTASAQKREKPKAKPSYNEDKAAKGGHSAKPATARDSSSQELHRIEQSNARLAGARRSEAGRAPKNGTLLRSDKQERNPPIQISSRGTSGKGASGKSANSYKGRLRHKGSHR